MITHYDQDEEEENDESGSEDRKDRFDEEKVFKEIKKGLESGYIMCGKALGKLTFKLIFYIKAKAIQKKTKNHMMKMKTKFY